MVEAVHKALNKDLGIKNSKNAQAKKNWLEIKNRILFYQDFAPGETTTSILKTVYQYLKRRGSYTLPIIDIMLRACATALNVNIRVWQNDSGFINELQFDVHPNPSQHTIHLLYSRTLNAYGIPDPTLDPNNVCHHCDALILKPSSEDECSIGSFSSDEEYSQKSQESTINTGPSGTPPPISGIVICTDDIEFETDEVPDHYIMYNAPKSNHYNKFKQDMGLFTDVVTKVVNTSPFNIDGNKIYQVKCNKKTWKDKLKDGRHWLVNWGKNWQLNGERRVAKCQGSIVCTNDKCPMFQVHNVANEADFARGMLEGSYQCSKCFQYSEQQWCGALRASEWDRETGIMTIWHQGKHIYLMKKPPIEKDDAAKMITMLKHIMRLNPYATKTQIMNLGSHYHLSRGDHRLSQLFIRIFMKNKSIYEQALKEVRQETVGLDWSSINAVVKLKWGQDSVNPYHIYKVNDKKWNSRLTFVMKSSKLSAETALKMDTRNKKTALTECVVFMDGLHSHVKDYITLTLLVENPIIEKTQRLASMECLTEDT